MTWAEDRATVGTDLSADPGAKTEGRAEYRLACSARSCQPLRDWHNALNPSRHSREQLDRGKTFDPERRSLGQV